MITPMIRYAFLIYHKEYEEFLSNLQDLGAVHIVEKASGYDEETRKNLDWIRSFNEVLKFLSSRVDTEKPVRKSVDPYKIVKDIKKKHEEIDALEQELVSIRKDMDKARPWGDYTSEIKQKLKAINIIPRFFTVNEKDYDSDWENQYYLEHLNKIGGDLYFVIFQVENQKIDINAEEVRLPAESLTELDRKYDEKEKRIKEINELFESYATKYLQVLREARNRLQEQTAFDQAINHTEKQADNKVMLVEGWVPETKETELLEYLEKENVLYVKSDVKSEDPQQVPILLRNNKFSRVFEPLQGLFDVPNYKELDLTPFFAPFFTLFFGFCLGDAGYGIVIVATVTIYKHTRASERIKQYLTMAQYLGIATIVMGIIGGTVFGVNLTNLDWAEQARSIVLEREQLFNLSLALGLVQILFGMTLKAYKLWRFQGFEFALATIGWILAIVSLLFYLGGDQLGWYTATQAQPYFYGALIASGILILFFSDPKLNIFARFGKGVWNAYNTVTGVFGDMLSYIRLFAIGISTAILGFVVNEIAFTFGAIPYVGPLVLIIILVIGHFGNLLVSSLSSFVHPMRLIFVEFYKNAGFTGGGKKYQPFKKLS
jgi:V/A-type H+/Na+-transporting ATPase subunit I